MFMIRMLCCHKNRIDIRVIVPSHKDGKIVRISKNKKLKRLINVFKSDEDLLSLMIGFKQGVLKKVTIKLTRNLKNSLER